MVLLLLKDFKAMKKVKAKDLVKGKRYWLDRLKFTSGVFSYTDTQNDPHFILMQDNGFYMRDDDGSVGFFKRANFYEIEEVKP